MKSWNVRILHKLHDNGEHEFFPAEVHYIDGFGKEPYGYGRFHASGDSVKDIVFFANELLSACEKPILESSDLRKEYKP